MRLHNVIEVIGLRLIDVERPEGDCSGCREELVLHFENGKELLIFVHPEEGLTVEGD